MEDVKPYNSKLEFDKERGIIIIRNARLSYPKIFRAAAFSDQAGEPRFSASFIANLDQVDQDKLFKYINVTAEQKFKRRLPSDKVFAKNGDDTGKPENAGAIVISASEKADKRPMVYNKNKKLTMSEAEVYGGCMVDAVIRPWVMDNTFGKRINASLVAVMFVGDNQPFGAPPAPIDQYFGVDLNQSLPETDEYQEPPVQAEADPW